jgi:uncharacterized protein YdaU (DUF1376 family)
MVLREKNMPAMPWFVRDYLMDTQHLTRDQHGAYLLLLGTAWTQGGTLPDDDIQLAAIAKATPEEWAAIKPVVMSFWTLTKRGWKQKRLMKELAYVTSQRERRKKAAQAGGRAKASKQTGKQGANSTPKAEQTSAIALAPTPTPTPTLVDKSTEDAALYQRAEAVLGKGSGGMVTQLKRAKGGSIELARAAIEMAATKHKPREYIGAIINKAAEEAGQPTRGTVGAI